MNRPTPISAFSDQRRTKSTTRSRTSCGTQIPVRVPQDFFLTRRAQPSTQPRPRPWSAPSSPRTRSVSASPPLGGGTFLRLKSDGSVLEQFLLPAVEHRWPQAQFFTQLRDWHFVHKMPPQDGYFFFWGEMLPFLPHTFAPLS